MTLYKSNKAGVGASLRKDKRSLESSTKKRKSETSVPIYLFDYRIKWRTFKPIHDKLMVDDTGPTPVHMDKVLWQMVRDRKIYMYVDETNPEDPVIVGLKLPKGRPIHFITNPKTTKVERVRSEVPSTKRKNSVSKTSPTKSNSGEVK